MVSMLQIYFHTALKILHDYKFKLYFSHKKNLSVNSGFYWLVVSNQIRTNFTALSCDIVTIYNIDWHDRIYNPSFRISGTYNLYFLKFQLLLNQNLFSAGLFLAKTADIVANNNRKVIFL